MKAVVLERRKDEVAILDREGVVHVIKNDDILVGQEIEISFEELSRADLEYRNRQKKDVFAKGQKEHSMSRMTQIAAAILVVLLLGGSVTAYAAPVGTVTLDAASSVCYETNIFNRVVKMSAYNEDGEAVVSQMGKKVRGKKIEQAVGMTLDAISAEESEETETIVVTVQNRFRSEDTLRERITEAADKARVEIVTSSVSEEMKETARENKESPGRRIYEELREKPKEPQNGAQEELIPESLPRELPDAKEQVPANPSDVPEAEKQTGGMNEATDGTNDMPAMPPDNAQGGELPPQDPAAPTGEMQEMPMDRRQEPQGMPPEATHGQEPAKGTGPQVGSESAPAAVEEAIPGMGNETELPLEY